MRINIKTFHLELPPAIREYLEKRLEALNKFPAVEDSTAIAEVEISKTTEHHQQGNIYRAEINLTVKGKLYRAVAEKETMQEAIDAMKDQIVQELRRDKVKDIRLARRAGLALKEFTQTLGERGGRITRRIRRR